MLKLRLKSYFNSGKKYRKLRLKHFSTRQKKPYLSFITFSAPVKTLTRRFWTNFMAAAYHQYQFLAIPADHPHLL